MSSRDKKAQVGARVPGDLLERAKASAGALGVSFNLWVEQAFSLKLSSEPINVGDVLRDVETNEVIDSSAAVAAIATPAHEDSTGLTPPAPAATMNELGHRKFDRACKNGTYHWKCSPGNPCRFCGGEV